MRFEVYHIDQSNQKSQTSNLKLQFKSIMFQIDRSYIDHISLESIQGEIWDIRTDYKDDPTLPKIENYHITEKAFEFLFLFQIVFEGFFCDVIVFYLG